MNVEADINHQLIPLYLFVEKCPNIDQNHFTMCELIQNYSNPRKESRDVSCTRKYSQTGSEDENDTFFANR